MRKLLAAVMLALFASLNAIDGVCCPDGCTHQERSASQPRVPEAADAVCLLCLGGVDSSGRFDLSPCGGVTAGIALACFSRYVDPPSNQLDPPPRS